MLSETATKLIIALGKKTGGKDYVIYTWNEVKEAFGEDIAVEEIQNLFEEARLNQCVSQKYRDDDEVCFALTDKGLLIKQDYELLMKQEETKQTVIKTDESGNSVIVLPKASHEIAPVKKGLSIKITAFLYGLLGGVLGGALVCGIMLLVQAL